MWCVQVESTNLSGGAKLVQIVPVLIRGTDVLVKLHKWTGQAEAWAAVSLKQKVKVNIMRRF
jgi:hypothetical protein